MGRLTRILLIALFFIALSVAPALAMGGRPGHGGHGGGGGGCGVPEIDPGVAPSAIALLSGGILILKSKLGKKK